MTSSTRTGARPRTPERTIVFAVGDIHGRLDLLERLTEQLDVEIVAAARDGKDTIVVFLGDYIDKGPDAAGVMAHLVDFRERAGCRTVFLRGNHEDVLIKLADGAEDSARWLEYGGDTTLESYGVSFRASTPNISVEKLRQAALAQIPAHHIAFLRDTELLVKIGDYIFVHAGLRPDRLIEEQTDSDMMWFRYYDDEPPLWAGTVVHGHSVSPRPVKGRSRIGIDTGAYASDALTALRLEGERQDFLKISPNPEAGDVEIDFWDSVDKAFAGAASFPAPRRRPAPDKAREDPKAPPKSRAKAKPAKAARAKPQPTPRPAAAGGRRQSPPPVFIAAGVVGLVAATVAAAVYYAPRLDRDLAPPDPATFSAELTPPVVAAAAPAEAIPPTGQIAPEDAALRPLNASAASDPPSAPAPAAAPILAAAAPAAPSIQEPRAAVLAAPRSQSQPQNPRTYRVQIAASPSVEDARRAWADLAQQFPGDMSSKAFATEAVEVGDRTLQRTLVTGFPSVDEARRFCDRLRQSGRSCILRPNG